MKLLRLIHGCLCRVQYGSQLEKVTFQFSTADFVYMLLFGMAALLVCLLFLSTYCADQRQKCLAVGGMVLAVRAVSAIFARSSSFGACMSFAHPV